MRTKTLVDAVTIFLEEHVFAFECDAEKPVFRFLFADADGDLCCSIHCEEQEHFLHVISRLPVRAPAPRRMPVQRCLNDLNAMVRTGAFVLDWEDGCVTFRVSARICDQRQTHARLAQMLADNLGAMHPAVPELLRLFYSDISAETAASRVADSGEVRDFLDRHAPDRPHLN